MLESNPSAWWGSAGKAGGDINPRFFMLSRENLSDKLKWAKLLKN